ncbi:C4b-binding protein-like isoform X1 [Chiloscyllium plagiosum]|uniref:C4b-binding protein-like isoform X1 n=1 Tax=Chiloscyllium plagiosum TaxID=36176 RepID=UPI001CB8584F|nr:C4b-binding protein-like isoform X1 [Chiloscyllium plagiosum]
MTKMFQKIELIVTFICIVHSSIALIDPNCRDPDPIDNGFFEVKISGNSVKKLFYQCFPGYTLTGTRYQHCEKSVWQPKSPKCKPISCGNPGEILNGYYNASSAEFGSRVSFYCNPGFKLIGNINRICQVSGWSGHVPVCEVIKCNNLEDIENGRTPDSPNGEYWEHGMVAQYSCDTEYSLIGAEELVCTETGEWNNSPPKCKAVKCEPPNLPENANIVSGYKYTYKYRETITYRCKHGYKIVGNNVIECGEDNEFLPPPPTCQLSGCYEPEPIENGKIINKKPVYELEEEVNYVCDWRYKLIGAKVIRCVENHRFEPSPPQCSRIICKVNTFLSNGQITSRHHVYYMDAAITYKCNRRFKPVADGRSTCQENGHFYPEPACVIVTCTVNRYLKNGQVTSRSDVYHMDDEITYSCDRRFKPVADGRSTCQENGHFYPEPACVIDSNSGRDSKLIQNKLKDIVGLGKQMLEEKERNIHTEEELLKHEAANRQKFGRILQKIEQLLNHLNTSQIC